MRGDPPRAGNLFAGVPARIEEEAVSVLAELPYARIERIVSTGQASPRGFWYDQDCTEWVVLLTGSAGLLIEGEAGPRILSPGAYVEIAPHIRHRVEWTDADEPTVWLAVRVADAMGYEGAMGRGLWAPRRGRPARGGVKSR